ncbi:MAG: hypothetical protein ACLT33_08070 [Lachnospira pectinoschiza]
MFRHSLVEMLLNNTNENPYGPSENVRKAMEAIDRPLQIISDRCD